jgi:hypothetical protein
MKKIILSAVVLGAVFFAENVMAQVTFGPKLALNVSSWHNKSKDPLFTPMKTTSKIGFQVGGIVNAQINKYFAIRPELTFNSIGTKASASNINVTYTTNYLSLPLNFVGQYPINDNFKLQAFAGPYASLGLGGKYKYESPYSNSSGKINMKKAPGNNGNDYQNPLDLGINFGVGFQARSFVFSASYALGLTNAAPHYKDSTAEANRGKINKTTNRNISFSVAYLFGKK